MAFKVLQDPNTPRGQEQLYAELAIKQATRRAAQQQAEREQEAERERQKRENFEAVAAQTAERKRVATERARVAAQKSFEDYERLKFFSSNPGASECDWTRNRSAILDQAMISGGGRGLVGELIRRKRASGEYGNR